MKIFVARLMCKFIFIDMFVNFNDYLDITFIKQ